MISSGLDVEGIKGDLTWGEACNLVERPEFEPEKRILELPKPRPALPTEMLPVLRLNEENGEN